MDGSAPDPWPSARVTKEPIGVGGIDIQVVGVRHERDIGFNEPATNGTRAPPRHAQAERAAQQHALFNGDPQPCGEALSMGGTILQARAIILLTTGAPRRRAWNGS